MPSLNRAFLAAKPALPAGLECGTLEPLPERILQFGEGNFLRAFVDWMVDILNEKNLFHGGVTVIQPIRQGLVPVLNAQDGLYTLLLRGVQNGRTVETRRIITSLRRGLNPYEDWTGFLACARNPELRFVVSNTTEAGIAYTTEAKPADACPETFPAKVAALLLARFDAFAGAADKGLLFLPCELIDKNGATLRDAVLRHLQAWNTAAAAAWVNDACTFCNTLVDRIVPGYPKPEAATLAAQLGYEDKLLDAGEIFHLWVIEPVPPVSLSLPEPTTRNSQPATSPAPLPRPPIQNPKSKIQNSPSPSLLSRLAAELPFHQAGLNVVWTNDLAPYRTRKVRVLNGAHTGNVPAAFLAGLDTVGEMMADPLFGKLVRQSVFEEILPVLNMDAADKAAYAEAVLERFRNPFIRHELLSICLNSVSKWKVRVLPSLKEFAAAKAALPPRLAFSLAAIIAFYRGIPAGDRELRGVRDGKPYPIRDDQSVLDFFVRAWGAYDASKDAAALVKTVLAETAFWGEDLTAIPTLQAAVTAALAAILANGVKAAAERLL